MKTTISGSARDVKAEARREAVLKAATRLFAQRGFNETRIVDIASMAGVSHGTVGNYFATKEELLIAAVEHLTRPRRLALRELVQQYDGRYSDFITILPDFFLTVVATDEMRSMMMIVDQESPARPEVAEMFMANITQGVAALLVSVIDAGVRTGEFECDDPLAFAHLMIGSLTHVLRWDNLSRANRTHAFDVKAFTAQWRKAMLGGLRAAQ